MKLRVNGVEVDFALDTGSEVTILTRNTFKSIGRLLEKPSRLLVAADGKELNVIGECSIRVNSKNKAVECKAFIIEGANRNLLGAEQIRELGLISIVCSVSEKAFDPFKEFPKLFKGLGIMPGIFKINLESNVEPYRMFAPRPIAAGLKEKAKAEIDKMLALDVIEPVEVSTDWCSGLTIAPKPNGNIRMCVDLTALNKGVRREIYPFPRVDEMLARLSKGKVFSKLDANSGFWQVMLEESSRLYTTFITPWGRYCFKRMPFGISSAPEYFQRAMEKILKGLEGVVCMMDDILVYGENDQQHWGRLKEVLRRIEQSGMTLKKEKCVFGVNSITFLGHLISEKGIEPNPEKVKAICEMNPPINKKEARRFMGIVNYLSKFSSKLAGLAAPIYEVMGAKATWYWGDSQQRAFEAIKQEVSKAPVLCTFDLSRKHRVSADSTKLAIGAVLLQSNDFGEYQPVEYASRKLSDAETRYAMVEKEALAVTWACEKFDFYLVGRDFEVETDHKPLVAILGEKDLSKLPLRVQRFKMRMMRYNYTIFHTSGSKMYLADALSRTNGGLSDDSLAQCAAVESFVGDFVEENLFQDVLDEELFTALRLDPVYQRCSAYLLSEWPENGKALSGELFKLYSCRHMLTTYGEFILFGPRLYIPLNLRDKYLERCHEGHQSFDRCYSRAAQSIWWPGMYSDVENYVKKCMICVKQSSVKHQPWTENPLPEGPWVEVGADVFQIRDELFLILVDYYTRWIETLPIRCQTSNEVVKAMKCLFARFGVPKKLRSDNGPCFASDLFKSFAKEWNFLHCTSSPRYPQSNGLAERAVGTVKRMWKKEVDYEKALLAYRSTPMKTGFSPFELMYGRQMRTSLGLPPLEYLEAVDYSLFEEKEKAYKALSRKKWNEKHRAKLLPELEIGARVWVKSPTDLGEEALVVKKDSNPESYWVKVDNKIIRRNRKHLYLLDGLRSGDGTTPVPNGGKQSDIGGSDSSDFSCLLDVRDNTNLLGANSNAYDLLDANRDVVDASMHACSSRDVVDVVLDGDGSLGDGSLGTSSRVEDPITLGDSDDNSGPTPDKVGLKTVDISDKNRDGGPVPSATSPETLGFDDCDSRSVGASDPDKSLGPDVDRLGGSRGIEPSARVCDPPEAGSKEIHAKPGSNLGEPDSEAFKEVERSENVSRYGRQRKPRQGDGFVYY